MWKLLILILYLDNFVNTMPKSFLLIFQIFKSTNTLDTCKKKKNERIGNTKRYNDINQQTFHPLPLSV